MKHFVGIISLFCSTCVVAMNSLPPAITQPIPVADIPAYKNYQPSVKALINAANLLAQKNLTYLYGSDNPANKGMDCSGTMVYLLKNVGVPNVPHSASQIYTWAQQKGKLYKVTQQEFNSPELNKLQPGDLLFWEGTYEIRRTPPITHVMIYLGKNSRNQPLMFGASDGRTYQSKKMWGVSVFDFKLTNGKKTKFVGYSCVPTLTCNLKIKLP